MPVALVTAAASGQATDTTWDIAFTVSANPNRALLVFVSCSTATMTVSSVVWNGAEALTQLATGASDSSAIAVWGRATPSGGTHNVTVTINAARAVTVVIVECQGVNPATPFGTAVADGYTGSGASHAHNTTSQASGLVVDVFTISDGAGTVTLNGGQTSQTGPTDYDTLRTVSSTAAGSGTVSSGASWPNDFWRWVHATVPVIPLLPKAPPPCGTGGPRFFRRAARRRPA